MSTRTIPTSMTRGEQFKSMMEEAQTKSGIVPSHINAIHRACMRKNTFLFIRPSTLPTMRLIKANFATKSMDVHDKSSDWGLTSGLVPCDQAFSKKRTGEPNPLIHPHAHGKAEPVKLKISDDQFGQLNSANHFEHMKEITTEMPCTATNKLSEYRHFHCDNKNAKVCFLRKKDGTVHWQWRDEAKKLTPVYVWGYNGIPVTGD